MIFFPQGPPLREIRDPAPMLDHDHIGPTLAHLDNDPPGGQQGIGEENVALFDQRQQLAQQGLFAAGFEDENGRSFV